MISYCRVTEAFSYNPETGDMHWRISTSPRIRIGDAVKGKTTLGYRRVMIDLVRYKAHNIIWFYMTGVWPDHVIDHIDCDPDNLKWSNLRDATQQQNCFNRSIHKNNTSGIKGVSWKDGRWQAYINVDRKRTYLGCFADIAMAAEVVAFARAQLHGEFANHGSR